LHDLAVTREIARLDVTLLSRDAVSELGFRLGAVHVERPGLYELQLVVDGHLLGSRPFTVVQSEEDS